MNSENNINVKACYLKKPTNEESGIIGIKINGINTDIILKAINIVLLIDTSGSMEGDSITAVKKTISILIEKLSDGDTITLIGFGSESKIIISNVTIDYSNKNTIIQEVDKLVAEGGTNLESAISALGQIGNIKPNAVIILTDGYINQGITSIAGIYSLIKSYLSDSPVYTLGYGENHNIDLLKNLATRTRASYTFIQEEIALPIAMGDMLGALKTEISSNTTLVFPDNWTCIEPIAEGGNTFCIGPIIANKPMWVMLNVPKGSIDKSMVLTYVQPNSSNSITFNTTDGSLDRMEMLEQMIRCEMCKVINTVSDYMKMNNLNKAKELLIKNINSLTISEAKNCHLVIIIKAQMAELLEEVNKNILNSNRTSQGLLARASNTSSNYGNQRGVSSNGPSLFSSPNQAVYSQNMSVRYNEDPQE